MGIRVTIGGNDYQVEDYSVSEEATPLAAGDVTGSVGEMTFSLPIPDPDIRPDHPITRYGAEWLINQPVEILSDTNYGFTLGRVNSVSPSTAVVQVSCVSRLGELNVFNVQAQPFIGSLKLAFEYYASLANINVGVVVDDEIADRQVTFPGFSGELWVNLKELAAAQDCDISLVSGVILLRPIRSRVAVKGRTFQQSGSSGGSQLAQAIEIYWYDTTPVTDKLVYPPDGWSPEVEILNVNAGEEAEYTLELSASLSSFQTPVMVTSVDQYYDSSSVYTVVADDGFPVTPSAWEEGGGKVEFILNPDTTSFTVKLFGAENVLTDTGEPSKSFSLALESDGRSARYSTVRILGTGVAFSRNLKRIRTGIGPDRTATEIGVTIDNKFINDLETLYTLGIRAAQDWAGGISTLSGEVSTVTSRGDKGIEDVMSFDAVEDYLWNVVGGGATFDQVKAWYLSRGFETFADVQEWWRSQTANDFTNQTFGNVQGARFWDSSRKRWFRIRSASSTPGGISIETADDDLTFGDVDEFFAELGYTFDDVEQSRQGLTFDQERMVGLRV